MIRPVAQFASIQLFSATKCRRLLLVVCQLFVYHYDDALQ